MKTNSSISLKAALISFLASLAPVSGVAVPNLINYQGQVTVNGIPFTGSGLFKLALVNAAGDTTYWSNDGTSAGGAEPADAVTLTVTSGVYSVTLGETGITNMSALPSSVFQNDDVHLRVWFDDGNNGSQLLAPDQRITAVGFSIVAGEALSYTGTVSASQLSGTISDSLLSSNVSRQNTGNTFTGSFVIDQGLTNNSITMKAGSPQSGSTEGGEISITGGTGHNAIGGEITISAGLTSSWSGAAQSSDAMLRGGEMEGNTSYSFVKAEGGKVISGGLNESHGGDLELQGGDGVGTNRNGGHVLIVPGSATGSGNDGFVGVGTVTPSSMLDVNGTVTATAFSGNGSSLTGIDAGNVSGVLNVTSIPDLNASKITSGTISDSLLSSNVSRQNTGNTFTGSFVIDQGLTNNSITMKAGSPQSGSTEGGEISITGGTGHNAIGGEITISAGLTSSWSGAAQSSDAMLRGGEMEGNTSYSFVKAGGGKVISGGLNESHGGDLELQGGDGVGTNRNGGDVLIIPGIATGSGNSGNVGINTSSPVETLHVDGNILATGTITPSSDRKVKKNIQPVSREEILAKVLDLPLHRWSYKSESDGVNHIGPMAQDFHEAFGVGANNVTIATVDADGVALAAIQGLNQKLENELKQKETIIARQGEEIRKFRNEIRRLAERIKAISLKDEERRN